MSKVKELTHEDVKKVISAYMNEEHVALVEKAYHFAAVAHKKQVRSSGEPYITHPVQVAGILAELRMDPETICAGYLHDIVEDTGVTLGDIQELFGPRIAIIVDGDTKISKIHYKSNKEQLAETHRKLLLAMSRDIRVMIVKLADRLHNMRTLKHLRPDKRRRISNETLEIYAPIADRLGISAIKWELEDLALRYLNPQQYYRIVHLMNSRRDQRIDYVKEAIAATKQAVQDLDLGPDVKIYGRPKHIYSIYHKMITQHKKFSQIYDLLAIRVVVSSIRDCYAVLGAVHTFWTPLPGRFKDYIAMPKANGYQSLHTTVIGPEGRTLEIQIRTHQMHKIAEYGIAAHWAYKEGKTTGVDQQNRNSQKLNVIKEILELQEESNGTDEFLQGVKSDVFAEKVYVLTPKGDVIEMPKGARPLDIAYQIHTEVGNHTVGAKANGKIVSLNYEVKNGDIVDILTSSAATGPSHDWINLVTTRRARNKIYQFFRTHNREANVNEGRQRLAQQLRDAGYDPLEVMTNDNELMVAEKFHYKTPDDMFAALGFGALTPTGLRNRFVEIFRPNKQTKPVSTATSSEFHNVKKSDPKNLSKEQKATDEVVVAGIDNLLTRLAHCCFPVPGEPIVGYITKGRGISVHRANCPNVQEAMKTGQQIIQVRWSDSASNGTSYHTDLEVEGYNRDGLLSDVLHVINNHTRLIASISGRVCHDKMATISATIGVHNLQHLQQIMDALKRIPDVYVVKRIIN